MKALRILKKVTLFFVLFLVIITTLGYVYLYVLPKGLDVTEVKPIAEGRDTFVMYAYEESTRKSIRVWTYKPEHWQDEDKIVFVMHGGGRNADEYLDAWVELAEQDTLLIVAPEFESKFAHISTNDYQEGNLFTFFGTKNPQEEWAYSVIENIFDHLKATNDFPHTTYDMFGHSAGGQFVHRMVLLMPKARIGTAIAANAGFYTFPIQGQPYPYGWQRTSIGNQIAQAYATRLVILLGELDNDPSLGTFRTTEPAMAQGPHRLARGSNFYQQSAVHSEEIGEAFLWELDTITEVGHNYRKMSEAALPWLRD